MIRSGSHTIFTLFALTVFLTLIAPFFCFGANNAGPKHCCPSEGPCEDKPKGEEGKNCCVQKERPDSQLSYLNSGFTMKPLELSAALEHQAAGLSSLERSSPRPEEPHIPLDETYKFTCAYLI